MVSIVVCPRCGRSLDNGFMVDVPGDYPLPAEDLCLCPAKSDAVDRVLRALAGRGFEDLDERLMVLLWVSPTRGLFDARTFNHHVGAAVGIASGRLVDFLYELRDAGYLQFDTATRHFEMTCRGRTAWSVIRTYVA